MHIHIPINYIRALQAQQYVKNTQAFITRPTSSTQELQQPLFHSQDSVPFGH